MEGGHKLQHVTVFTKVYADHYQSQTAHPDPPLGYQQIFLQPGLTPSNHLPDFTPEVFSEQMSEWMNSSMTVATVVMRGTLVCIVILSST